MEEKTISLADLSNYRLVSKEDWEKTKQLTRELSQERNMWKEKYEVLDILYSALDSAYDKVVLQCRGYEEQIVAAAEEE